MTKLTILPQIRKLVRKTLSRALKANLISENIADDALEKFITDEASSIAAGMYDGMLTEPNDGLANWRKELSGFTDRNYDRWNEAFDLIEIYIGCVSEIGQEWQSHLIKKPERPILLVDALAINHAKALLIAQEIMCLMKGGFADGAMARWRSLHEVAVVMSVLSESDELIATRYRASMSVHSYKSLRQYAAYQERANLSPIEPEDLRDAEIQYDDAICKFGPELKHNYGWAAPLLKKSKPTLYDLEAMIGLDHWRPRFGWASHYMHGSLKWPLSYLGASEARDKILLVGPSNSGLLDPGHSTAISLCLATLAFLRVDPRVESVVAMEFVSLFPDDIGERFRVGAKRSKHRKATSQTQFDGSKRSKRSPRARVGGSNRAPQS